MIQTQNWQDDWYVQYKGYEYVRETSQQIRKCIKIASINISDSGIIRLTFFGILPPGFDVVFSELKQDTKSLLHSVGKMENKE